MVVGPGTTRGGTAGPGPAPNWATPCPNKQATTNKAKIRSMVNVDSLVSNWIMR